MIFLVIGFVAATIIGTVSHEAGHYLVARYLGYHPVIHYQNTSWYEADSFLAQHPGSGGEVAMEHSRYLAKLPNDRLPVLWGGPVQTMLTGSIGFILLLVYSSVYRKRNYLKTWQWLLIFIALFWLRQLSNGVVWIAMYSIRGSFGLRMDEVRLAMELHWPFWFIILITAILAAIVLGLVVFYFVPRQQRFTFLISGLVGGVTGYILWFHYFGPVLLP